MKFEGFQPKEAVVEIITTGADTLPKDVLETHSARLISREDIFQ